MADLTNKQRVFVEAYLTCWNATEAARQAEYAQPNVEGPKNLAKPSIAEEIKRRLAEKAMSADEVLARLGDVARADMRDFIRWGKDGEFAGIRLKQDQPMHLVKKLKPTRYGYEIELHDSYAALALLAKHHGLLLDLDLSKLPEAIVRALAEGMGISELRRFTTEGAE